MNKEVWIPVEVLQCEELSATDKMIFAVIGLLSSGGVGCIASNSAIGDTLNVGKQTASNSIAKLTKLKFVESAYSGKKVRKLTIPQRLQAN